MERRYRNLIIVSIIGIILALISATYAYWMIAKIQTNSNIITSKCLDISITGETNDINLVDAYPITDEEGESTVPYTFTITNNCNSAVDYQVALESIGNAEESLKASSIKIKFDNKNSRTLDKYYYINTTIEGAYAANRLAIGTLAPNGEEGSTKTYNLRLWIDEAVTIEESGKSYEGKISVSIGDTIQKIICEGVTTGTLTTGNIPSGEYNYGDEYICTLGGEEYHFFVLENGDNTTLIKGETGTAGTGEIALIMDRNIGNTVAWISRSDWDEYGGVPNYNDNGSCQYHNNCETNAFGPITASKYLVSQTISWEATATLPIKDQIIRARGNNTLNLPNWLYINLNLEDQSASQVTGYWTSTPAAGTSTCAWFASIGGQLHYNYVYKADTIGIRPVITLNKSLID